MLKPLPISARSKIPTIVRQIAPSPPAMLVPPMTTAAIAVSSIRLPASACPVETREEATAGDHDRQAADHHAGRQGGYEGVDLESRDKEAIEQTKAGGHEERNE